MASTVRMHNHKGARTLGDATRTRNEGDAADSIAFYAGEEFVCLRKGEHWDALTRDAKSDANSGLLSAGWISHTHHNAREHASGATLEIERNFWVAMPERPDGWVEGDPTRHKVVARYTRSS